LNEEKRTICLDVEQWCRFLIDELGGARVIAKPDLNVIAVLEISDW
jgi:hypothetical protein